MSKELTPLEALERIRKNSYLTYLFTYYEKELDIIETALKALEIIKERVVDVGYIIDCQTESEYLNRMCHRVYAEQNDFREKPAYKRLSKEEYDLLKEVLL